MQWGTSTPCAKPASDPSAFGSCLCKEPPAAAPSPAGSVVRHYCCFPQYVYCMVRLKKRHGAELLSKAQSQTEPSWNVSLDPGTPRMGIPSPVPLPGVPACLWHKWSPRQWRCGQRIHSSSSNSSFPPTLVLSLMSYSCSFSSLMS